MIEVLLLTGGIVFIALVVSYSLTVLPMFWSVLLRYVDEKIREEVRILFDEEIQKRIEELKALEDKIREKEQGVALLKEAVGKKLEKDKLSPIGKERKMRPMSRY